MQIKTDILTKSAQYIKGVGPARFKILNRLGIYTVGDLLYYFPRRYEDRRNFTTIAALEVGSYATVKGELFNLSLRRSKKGLSIFQVVLGDETGVIEAIWFNQPFMKRYFKVGQEVILYGRIEKYRRLQMNSPDFEFVSKEDASLHMGRIVPIYPLTSHINQRYLRTIISRAEEVCCSFVPDMLPYGLRQSLDLLPLTLAIRYIHFPQDFSLKEAAYKRLVFDEFFLFQIILALKKLQQGKQKKGIAHKREGRLIEAFKKALPFKLTRDQEKVIKEIENDMANARPMSRLLQGDVGSGKTIVAVYALVLSLQSGFQAALMAPTEILAEQHYLSLSKLLLPLGVNVGILISSMSLKAKQQTLQDLQSGQLDIVIGTHALIEENIQFKKLGLVVVDEQHKFGVVQRSLLRQKGRIPDYLVMTATPIPRTLAMTLYGDLDISTIKELPKGRRPISTFRVENKAIKDVYKFIREEISSGRQAYIVYPLVKRSLKFELKAATEMYQKLKQEQLSNLRLGLIHGQMKALEKEKVMQEFKNHKIDILISTTVIEVGIDISNASVMVIEHAERFGLSQLHQLRGRIGRGPHLSYCILVSDAQTKKANLRLEAMLGSSDGFFLANQDLDIRGPGQFFGPAQHGLAELKIGNIVQDMQLMELAREEAFSLVKGDPNLNFSQHLLIRKRLQERFSSENIGLLWV
ncbi:MAG: ATP-dependent DNA helicase RecG [Candidatus Omnitrophica bacterium]|nr:ATP-dependent DNA helicase RecG [Candidatus Omnitrophota bacterium]